MLAQMAGHQLNGFTGADQQHGNAGERFKDLSRQSTGGKRHGDRAGADIGFGTHAFGHRERLLEHALQLADVQMSATGISKGFFHLPEDLRLAQHQRIKTAGDAHQMADRIVVLMPVEAFAQVVFI